MLAGLQACNYSAMSAICFTFWDILITMEDEVREVWRGPWTPLKILCLFLRYYSLFAQLLAAAVTMKVSSGLNLSQHGCEIWVLFQGASSSTLMVLCQFVLTIRVCALYRSNRPLVIILRLFYVAEALTIILLLSLSQPDIKYGTHCVVIEFPLSAIGFGAVPLIFDTTLFALTMAKFYKSIKEGWGRESVIARFMQDGIWAYALPFLVICINTGCMAFLNSALSSVAFAWLIAIPPFAGYRLILNMSHLLRAPRHYDPELDYTDAGILTTVAIPRPLDTDATMDSGSYPMTPTSGSAGRTWSVESASDNWGDRRWVS
ncbi:hypothetical protein GLOTRDRAFT_135595 [Gloeophyllum trabeum ATCC 11539]|uniref:DUF6533 domain-containing protein n=1 Tax=Gloeophyllum trabeum (strain ATCC 11539 / FP-39264 / Madison 617) TaxID=670483 RepID=S7QND9_GLOTA|nr:uncharacterized protein GLOTRDRAFT_135595 [Gloeophyllum trabeum ATCC 11539]EPQ61023.1 hypothetical protein GLOTRDRAFT_135595 [Gloeophyllum trabeum ATCC 11539]